MRSSGPNLRPNGTRPTHPHIQTQPQTSASSSQHSISLVSALETLDNEHSFWLLQSVRVVEPHLLCLRTSLAHQLNQHHLCLQFLNESLRSKPCCPPCLQTYLAHIAEDNRLSSLRPKILQALSQDGSPLALEWLLRIAETGERNDRYRRLLAELAREEGRVEKLEVVEMQANDRKIVARAQIKKDQVILFVPRHKLITLELARTLPLVDRIFSMRVHLRSPKHTQLAVFLLHQFEKGKQSLFHNYLQTLPTDFSRFPINYPQQLLKELRGTCFLEQIEAKQQDLRKDYEVIVGVDESFRRFGLQRFIEARLLICSRVFGVIVDRVKTDALVPVADMLNHQMPKQTSWYFCQSTKGFVIQSLRDIPLGAEIFDSYGQKCNSRFLLNYGFTLPDNPHNEVALTIITPSLRPFSTRLRVSRIIDSKGFNEMMGVLRTAANPPRYTEREGEAEGEGDEPMENAKQTPFTSIDREVRAWQLLESIIIERLREYPTTLAQDRRLLQRAQGRLADVITLRLGEKEVLQYYLTMARKVAKSLGSHARRSELAGYETYLAALELQGRTQQ